MNSFNNSSTMINLYGKNFQLSSILIGLFLLANCLISISVSAQTYPVPGFTLPNGKTISISYEVDVNANACPDGTIPLANISNQSNVSGSNFATVQTDDPDIAGASNPTLTPFGSLTLGNLVYRDMNSNGIFDAGDVGVDGVLMQVYADDGDGVLDAGDGAAIATTGTAGGGLYAFILCPGNYIVEVAASNFNIGGALYDNGLMAGLISSPVGGAPDPDNDLNNDDNGDPVAGFGVASAAITLGYGAEPVTDGDANANTNLTLDFGFKLPTVVTIDDVTMAEGTGGSTTSFNFTVTRSISDETFSLTVNTMDGTAVSPSDFTAITGGTVMFTSGGSLTQTVTVLVNHDDALEANETFTVNLSGAPGGIVISDDSGLGTITNDDAATVTLSGGISQAEGTSFVFTATLNNPVDGGFSIEYATNNGSATTADNDYTDNDGPALVFAGTAGESHTITVNTTSDNKVELDETFTVALGAITGPPGIMVEGSPQTGTITNDDAAVVAIANNVTQAEASSPQVFNVTLSNPVDVAVTVSFNTSNGTATTADNDYTGIVNQTVTFAAGTTTTQMVNVAIINDTKVEEDEVYNVAISNLMAGGRNVTLGTAAGTGTIVNDDSATLTLSGGTSVAEGNSGTTPLVFSATLNNAVQGGFMVAYTTNDGTATTGDSDYQDNDGSLTFIGTAGEVQMVSVLINGDLNIEPDETFTVALGALSGSTAVQLSAITPAASPQTGTILNDELDWGDAPTAAQSGFAGTYPTLLANNGARHALVPGGLRLGAAVDADADGQPDGNATGDGADEDGVSMPASFITGTTANITVNSSGSGILNAWLDFNRDGDWSDAGEQIFTNQAVSAGNNPLMFAVPSGASLGTSFSRFRLTTASGTLMTGLAADGEVEDYQVSIIANQFSIDNPSVVETNAGTTTLTYTVTRTTNVTDDEVDYAITGGTATAGSDYISIPGGTLMFPMGGALSQTINVTVNGDVIVEADETILITLSNPVGGGIGMGTGTGTITNDDNATLTLSGSTAQNETNAGTVSYTFTATLNAVVQDGFEVAYTTNNGTATTADNDYVDNDGTLTFAGTMNEAKTITVLVNGDNKVELDETFTVALGAISATSMVQAAAITITGSPQTGTITNDDAAVVALANNVSQAEASTPQVFNVTLSNPVDVAVTVSFNTSNGTATTADNDYTGIVNQTVTFAAGTTTTQMVNVAIINDSKVEDNEVYNVSISNLMASGRNVTLGTTARTGTIVNDDSATLTLSGGTSVAEGNSGTTPMVFSATLNNAVQGGFMVAYTTNDGTATTANSDYQDNDGLLTFAGTAGEVQMITVLINGDLNIEPDETFNVALGALSGATSIQLAAITPSGSPQTGTILNDELDWGDAPTAAQSGFAGTYPTLLANNGARHALTPGGLHLGAAVDADSDGQPDATATGDGADEDGVIIPGALVINNNATFTITSSGNGFVNAWIDYNRDGDWSDAGEQVITNLPVVTGSNPHTVFVPAGASLGNTFARFRLATLPGATFTGAAADGEVEDYAINVVNTQFSIDDPSVVEGDAGTSNLVFTITRSNNVGDCSVDYAITGGTATAADNDYQPFPGGTASFVAGGSLTQTVTVVVNGDLKVELDETVIMTLSNPMNSAILDGSGTGTIVNDDAAVITISNPAISEGDLGIQLMIFDVLMSNPSDAPVSYFFTTMDLTATAADNDYVFSSGPQILFPGQVAAQIIVPIISDCVIEPDEILLMVLNALNTAGRDISFSGGGSTLTGAGTIINEDFPPVITCPPDVTISCEASSDPSNTGMATAIDDCLPPPVVTFSDVITPGNCQNEYTITRTWKATDGTNDMSFCTQTITVIDVTPPLITCPPPVTVQCANLVPAVNTLSVMTSDNCDPSPLVTHVGDVITDQSCFNRFTITRTYRSTDACGNTSDCDQVITVFDNTPPVLTCPNPITVTCASQVPTPNITLVTAVSDNCSGPAPVVTFVSDVVSNQTCFNRFTITRTYRATDACGNSAICTQIITVFDNIPPSITCPAPVTVQCANQVPAVNVGSLITADNCTGPAPVVTHVSDIISNQTCFNRFTLTRTYRSTDACGNASECSQIITVFDNTPPTITCPGPLTVQCASQVPPINTASVITADNCGGPAPVVTHVSDVITNQTCINRFTLTRTYRSTDACGNFANCTQVITVFDNTAPVITFTHPLLMGLQNGGTLEVQCFGQDPMWDPPTFNVNSVSASDNCAGPVTVLFMDQLLDEGDCPGDGYINRHRLTWTAIDACGNMSTRFVFVELIDAIPPVLTGVPANITVSCTEIPEPPVVTGSDECLCACDIVYAQSGPAPGCQHGQVVTRTWTATDNCGNITTGIQLITLVDLTPPEIIITQPGIAGLSDGTVLFYTCNKGGIPAFFDQLGTGSVVVPTSCGGSAVITFAQSQSVVRNCEFFGYIEQRIYTWTAIDQCGNKTVLALTVRLVDDEPPVLIGVPEMACMGDPILNEIEVIDNCSNGNIRFWDVAIPNPCGNGMAIRRTYEAFDPCGNMVRDTSILVPNDNIPPVMHFVNPDLAALEPGEILTVNCKANDENYTSYGIEDVMAADNCPHGVSVSFSQTIVTKGDCSNNGIIASLILEWTASDLCGNTSQLFVMVNVVDQTAPEFINFKGEITIGCSDPIPTVEATDNCGEVSMMISETIVPRPCKYEYDIVRRVSASDPCGNITTVVQTIHVGDGKGPIITGVVPEVCDESSMPEVTAWDPCAKEFVEVFMTESIVDVPCRDGKVIERVWTAIDACGNVSGVRQIIILDDHTPPEILYPTWSVIGRMIDNTYNLVFLSQESLMEQLDALDVYSIFVEDECDQAIIPVFTLDVSYADDCVADGYYERRVYTWVATDVCGNSSSISFSVDIMDDVAPKFVDEPEDLKVICQPLPPAPVVNVEDYGQPVNIAHTQTIVPGPGIGEFVVTRTWEAIDPCGNSASHTQDILWIPDTGLECNIILPGAVDCNSHGVVISSATSGGLIPFTYQWSLSGPGLIQSGQGTPAITMYIGYSDVNISLTVTDAFGCSSVCHANLDCLFSFGGLESNPTGNHPVAQAELANSEIESYSREADALIEIWPNPTEGKFQLRYRSIENEVVELSITDLLGKVVLRENILAGRGIHERSIDLTHVSEGAYLVQIKSDKKLLTRKVLVVRSR